MELDKLKSFKAQLYKQSLQSMPAATQLSYTKAADKADNTQYKI